VIIELIVELKNKLKFPAFIETETLQLLRRCGLKRFKQTIFKHIGLLCAEKKTHFVSGKKIAIKRADDLHFFSKTRPVKLI
jgi:hypothetical protein